MESLTPETSPPPTGRGLKGVIAKARRGLKDNTSTTSINGTDGNSGVRSSIDSTIEKLKTRASGDPGRDDKDETGSGGISKLIPGRIKRRKKKRETSQAGERDHSEEPRGRSIGDGNGLAGPGLGNRSQSTVDDDGGSSLLTYDSEVESPLNSPPPLLSHQSHIGYLTSSSPLIRASAAEGSPSTQDLGGTESDIQTAPRATTSAASSSTPSVNTKLAPKNAVKVDPFQSVSTQSVNSMEPDRSRGVSPGSKAKDALTPASLKKDGYSNSSSDRNSTQSPNGKITFGGIFGSGERRGSISLRRASRASENPPPISHDVKILDDRPKTSTRDLSTIVTTPRTPPGFGLEAPVTTITPPTPTDQQSDPPNPPLRDAAPTPPNDMNSNTVTSASGNMISHRRVRSDSATHPPSKLSSSMSAPLTPMIEESKTPGSRASSGNISFGNNGGFFSSVFVAAQNAANTLSNTIANNPPRPRSGTQTTEEEDNKPSEISAPIGVQDEDPRTNQPVPRTIDTIGSGDLSLSHLGISTEQPPAANAVTMSFPSSTENSALNDEAAARAEDASAARAVSAAYGDKLVEEGSSTPVAQDVTPSKKQGSIAEQSVAGEQTPPTGSIFEGKSGNRRSASVRSRVGAVARRHRNSSGATGTTIGAAISASHAALGNSSANGSVPKLTGFAVASKKRNRDFHQLFRSVPEDDYLIEDYSCALQRDIILAGRIYVSEGHICFSSNILGWVTTLIISFDEVVSIEKESTAVVFPNAIAIQTLHARHTFRSLLSREATYDLLVGIWKISHPTLKSSENGVRLAEGDTNDKTEKVDASASDDGSAVFEEDEDIYDEDEEDDEAQGSVIEAGDGSILGSEDGEAQIKSVSRQSSAIGVAVGNAAGAVPTQSESKAGEKAGAAAAAASADFPGPASHTPTECSDGATHYDKVLKDDIVPAPLGKVFSMIFGAASGGFMTKWLLDDQKVMDLQMEDDKKGLSEENKSRTYSYIKPLNASIGPKQTKCIITESIDAIDLEKAVSVTVSTQTPDVPSGNVFTTKTKFCLTWAPGNATRIFVNSTVEWTGKSWLKGPIEKGANDGQLSYANDLVKALKAGLSSRLRAGTVGSKSKQKVRRKKGDGDVAKKSQTTSKVDDSSARAQNTDWGLLEPLHGILGPVVDIFSPLITSNTIIGVLLFLLLVNWFRGSRIQPSGGVDYRHLSSPQRIAAYEQLWRQEENDLWDWLESRVGMANGFAYPASAHHENHDSSRAARMERQQVLRGGKEMESKLDGIGMSDREVKEALRVTEEKLRVLKNVVEGKTKGKGTGERASSEGKGDPVEADA